MIRKYVVIYNNRTIELAGKDAVEAAQRWSEKGATVKAEMITEPGDEPPNLTELDKKDLDVLGSVAAKQDWDHLLHQIRQEQQKQVLD